MSNPFERIRRHSFVRSECEYETDCSTISKQSSIQRIRELIGNNFKSYTVYLHLKNNLYLDLLSEQVTLCPQIESVRGNQYFEFNCTRKDTEIKSLVWLAPESLSVNLVEKHYLQVISRAIEEGFQKFTYKNTQFYSTIHSLLDRKMSELKFLGLKGIKTDAKEKMKMEEYQCRDLYYETNIEVENYKLMEKEQRKEEKQRETEKNHIYSLKEEK